MSCSPQTPRPRAAGRSECGSSMLEGAHSYLRSTVLRAGPRPPCYFTSQGNGLESLGNLLTATQNSDWLEGGAPGPCFLPARREDCEEVSHSSWDHFMLLRNSCSIPVSASLTWSGRGDGQTQVSPRPRQRACLYPSQLLLPPGSGRTQPHSTVGERTPLPFIQVMRTEFRSTPHPQRGVWLSRVALGEKR